MTNHEEHMTKIIKFRFKTSMLRSCSCAYSDAYILVKEIITVANTAA